MGGGERGQKLNARDVAVNGLGVIVAVGATNPSGQRPWRRQTKDITGIGKGEGGEGGK